MKNIKNFSHRKFIIVLMFIAPFCFMNSIKSSYENYSMYDNEDEDNASVYSNISHLTDDQESYNYELSEFQTRVDEDAENYQEEYQLELQKDRDRLRKDLTSAIFQGEFLKVEELITKYPYLVNCEIRDGVSALWIALYRDNPKLVTLLLKHGADRSYINDYKQTPLEYAQELDDPEMIAILERVY